MHIHLIAIGKRPPAWIENGYQEFSQRLTGDCELHLVEIATPKRTKNSVTSRLMQEEGEAMLAAIPKGSYVIALDVKGTEWDTPTLAQKLQQWQLNSRPVSLLVGGPDGLAPECLKIADQKWSLSKLTLPHFLVRVVVAEQLYRAWSILHRHPYHRE